MMTVGHRRSVNQSQSRNKSGMEPELRVTFPFRNRGQSHRSVGRPSNLWPSQQNDALCHVRKGSVRRRFSLIVRMGRARMRTSGSHCDRGRQAVLCGTRPPRARAPSGSPRKLHTIKSRSIGECQLESKTCILQRALGSYRLELGGRRALWCDAGCREHALSDLEFTNA